MTAAAALSTTVGSAPPETAAWEALCDEVRATPFQRPSWLVPWYRAFAPDDMWFVESRADARLVGVLPLRKRYSVVRSPTNWHTPLFAPVALDEDVERSLLEASSHGAAAVILRFVPSSSATPRLFAQVLGEEEEMSIRSRSLLSSPRVDVHGSWEEYEGGLSKTMLKTLRRRRRRLEELGRVDVEVVTDPEAADERLAEGLAVETAGWKGRRGTAIAADDRLRRFYEEFTSNAARTGRLSLAFLRLDARPIAFHLDLIDDGVLYGLKGTYAEDLAPMSPSRILRHERIKQAFESGLRAYEFLGADEPYKAEWANASTCVDVLEAYRSTPAGKAIELVNTHGRDVARRFRTASVGARRRMSSITRRPKAGSG